MKWLDTLAHVALPLAVVALRPVVPMVLGGLVTLLLDVGLLDAQLHVAVSQALRPYGL